MATSVEMRQREAAYCVALKLAKGLRPYSYGMFCKETSIKMLECFQDIGKEFIEQFESIPLSEETLSKLTKDIGAFVNENLKETILKSKYYSICIHYLTEIAYDPHLIVCIRTVDGHFNVIEELGALRKFEDKYELTGKELFDAINEIIFAPHGISKLSSISMECNAAMTKIKEDFVDQLLKNNINVHCYNCVMHHQEYLTKALGMQEAMDVTLNISNKLSWLHDESYSSELDSFLDDIAEEEYDYLLLISNAQYLTRGKIIDRLLDLKEEIVEALMKQLPPDCKELKLFNDPNLELSLCFISDMANFINLSPLQSSDDDRKSVFDLFEVLSQYKERIRILKEQLLQSENFDLMRNTRTKKCVEKYTLLDRKPEFVNTMNRFMVTIEIILNEFEKIKELALFNAPLTCEILDQDISLHEELQRMRSSSDRLLSPSTGLDFWKEINEENYPKSKNAIYKMYSMFGSTSLCELALSSLKKLLKERETCDLSESDLESIVRIKCCPYQIDSDEVAKHSTK